VNYDLQPSYIMQYNLSVQRALLLIGPDARLRRLSRLHLIRVADANLALDPRKRVKTYQPSLGRRNATFGVTQPSRAHPSTTHYRRA